MIVQAFIGKGLIAPDGIEVRLGEKPVGKLIEYDPITGMASFTADALLMKELRRSPDVSSISWKEAEK